MEEQFNQVWAALHDSNVSLFFKVAAVRGFLAFIVPIFNGWFQGWLTKLLVASPTAHNALVAKKWYRTISLIGKMTLDVKLPTQGSILVHEAKEEEKRQTQILRKEDL